MFSKTLTSLAFGCHTLITGGKLKQFSMANYVPFSDLKLDYEPNSKGFSSSIPLMQCYFIACLELNASSSSSNQKPMSSKTVFKNISQSVFGHLVSVDNRKRCENVESFENILLSTGS